MNYPRVRMCELCARNEKALTEKLDKCLIIKVGVDGFEPPTLCL